MSHVLPFLPIIRDVLVGLFGVWFTARATSPKAHEVAAQLAMIADAAAAAAVTAFPGADWATLLAETIRQIKGAAGLSVSDSQAIAREAARALRDAGFAAPGTVSPVAARPAPKA